MHKSPLDEWHRMVADMDPSKLDELIDSSCTFYSPVVFKPQEGKRLTIMYLKAAYQMFNEASYFKYVKEIVQEQSAMLEFNAEIDGILIDGIDLITWNTEGKIIEFKVMVRPFKAIDLVKDKMLAHLSEMTAVQKLKLKGGILWDKFRS